MMTITATNGRGQDAVARCQSDHAAAVLALATAEAALDNAGQAYAVALGKGREAAFTARRVQSDAEVDRDVARHAVDHAAARLHAAREVAAATELERLATEARDRISAAQVSVTRELKAATASVRRAFRLLAEAGLAREAALRAGVAEADIPEVEGFRDVPRLPRKVIETTRVTRWIHPWTKAPLGDEQSKHVSVGNGEAYLHGGGDPMRLRDQAVFDRVVYLPERQDICATGLMEAMIIPGLMADDGPGWIKPEIMTPHTLLAHLDALEGAPAPDRTDRRIRQVELVRVSDVEGAAGPARADKASADCRPTLPPPAPGQSWVTTNV